ncbi:MAG: TIGR03560 family F420-dependent LLM class oxidoreductase [Chloroflexi bacterium]|nr:TIGR03560 family F420-dependent LLM class oxidoreductase [Chloroflexota bacterium]
MDVGLMVEGQHDLDWERWLHILRLAERLGFPSLFRSDHYFINDQRASLETWTSLAVAARETSTIRFGPLVAPVTFRHPVDVGRMAAQLDLLSGGRFVLGVGNGWHQPEHDAYGIPFPEPAERAARLGEAIQLMKTMWGPGPVSFDGRYYQLRDIDVLPKPAPGRPYLLIGGSGPKRTLRYVAQYADEWNTPNVPPATLAERIAILDAHCESVGRDPASVRKTMMSFGFVGPDDATIERNMALFPRMTGKGSLEERKADLRSRGQLVGRADEVVDQLGRLAEGGISEVQFQHLDFHDDTVPEFLASEVAPQVKDL